MPTWEQTIGRARAMGWLFGSPRRPNIGEWYKIVDGKMNLNGGELWNREIEEPLWRSRPNGGHTP